MAGRARIIAAVVTAVLLGTAAFAATPGWTTFAHPRLGFSLSYPEDWSLSEGITGVAFMAVGPTPAGVDRLRINVNVTYEEVASGTTVEQYDAQNESGMGMLFAGYRRLRTDRTISGAYPAVVRYYTWKRDDGVELYQMQLVTIAESRGYVVTGTTAAASTRLDQEAQLLVGILMTFRPR